MKAPLALLKETLERARQSEPDVPEAMALATVDASGAPSVRIVLVRGVDDSGLRFFTNFGSRKARELAANDRAAVCFHWKTLREQVRVEGRVVRLAAAESDAYFASRPRDSQLGAWASRQSSTLDGRPTLDRRLADVTSEYDGMDVPRPEFWGGYRLEPELLEFWYHKDSRLHHRVLYERSGDGWTSQLLYP